MGKVRRRLHKDALSIFDYGRLVRDDEIVYGDFRLDLATELPLVVAQVRQFLKDAAIA